MLVLPLLLITIHDDISGRQGCLLQQRPTCRGISGLAWREGEFHRRSSICGNQMNLGGPPGSRLSDCLCPVFFNALVPSGWPLTARLSSETAWTCI